MPAVYKIRKKKISSDNMIASKDESPGIGNFLHSNKKSTALLFNDFILNHYAMY